MQNLGHFLRPSRLYKMGVYGGSLRYGNKVTHGDGSVEVGPGYINQFGSEFLQHSHRLLHRPPHLRLHRKIEELPRYAEAQPTDALLGRGSVVRHVDPRRRRVVGIVAGNGVHCVGCVHHRSRHGAAVVQPPRERADPVTAHESVGWFVADKVAKTMPGSV